MQRHYKLLIVTALILLTLGLMFLDRTSVTPDDAPILAEMIPAGQKAPDVTFTLLDGGSISLHSLAGHKLLLHFWASWCAPCRTEFSSLVERIEKDDDTILLAVSGDAKAEDAAHFLAPYRRDFKPLFDRRKIIVAIDPRHALIEGVFQTFQYPETIVIAPDMTMRQKIAGTYR